MVFHRLLKTAKDSEKIERDLCCPKLPVHPPIFSPAAQTLWHQAEFPSADSCISLLQSPGKLISFIPCTALGIKPSMTKLILIQLLPSYLVSSLLWSDPHPLLVFILSIGRHRLEI